MIGRDVYVALAVVVAKTPYIHESDSSIWFYCKLVLSNAEKYPDKLDKLITLQNIKTLETLRYPEIGVRVTGSAMFFSFCGDVIDLTR